MKTKKNVQISYGGVGHFWGKLNLNILIDDQIAANTLPKKCNVNIRKRKELYLINKLSFKRIHLFTKIQTIQ